MTNRKRPRLYIDILLATISTFVFIVCRICRRHYCYMAGLTNYSQLTVVYGFWIFLLALSAFTIVIILILRAVLFKIRFGNNRLILHIILVTIPITLGFILPKFVAVGYPVFSEGFLQRMEKEADVSKIQIWLQGLDLKSPNLSEISESTWSLSEAEWPDEIKKFSPRFVIVKKLKNDVRTYVRIWLGSPLIGDWGIVVGVGPEEIPLNDYFTSEYRLELSRDAFVWYRIKPVKEESAASKLTVAGTGMP